MSKRRYAAIGFSAMRVLGTLAVFLGLRGSGLAATLEAREGGDEGAAGAPGQRLAAISVPFGEHWIELEELEQARSEALDPRGGVAALRELGVEQAAAMEFVRFFGELRVSAGEEERRREEALQSCHDEMRDAIDVGCIARHGVEIRNRQNAAAKRQGGRRRRVKKE